MNISRRIYLPSVVLAGLVINVWAKEDPAVVARGKAMRDLAYAVKMGTIQGEQFQVVDEPSYRWDDPARRFGDGTVWVYGKTGRPAALLTLSFNKNARNGAEWLHELTSLSDATFSARSNDGRTWSPRGPGIALKPIPNAPAPADDEVKRLRQMRDQARRFKAFENLDPTPNTRAERYELRLLTKPIHRYKDPARGILDGGIFLIAYGQNPEIVLVIEARGDGKRAPVWSYGLNRIAMAVLHVSLDDKELGDWPSTLSTFGATSAYYIYGIPATNLDPAK